MQRRVGSMKKLVGLPVNPGLGRAITVVGTARSLGDTLADKADTQLLQVQVCRLHTALPWHARDLQGISQPRGRSSRYLQANRSRFAACGILDVGVGLCDFRAQHAVHGVCVASLDEGKQDCRPKRGQPGCCEQAGRIASQLVVAGGEQPAAQVVGWPALLAQRCCNGLKPSQNNPPWTAASPSTAHHSRRGWDPPSLLAAQMRESRPQPAGLPAQGGAAAGQTRTFISAEAGPQGDTAAPRTALLHGSDLVKASHRSMCRQAVLQGRALWREVARPYFGQRRNSGGGRASVGQHISPSPASTHQQPAHHDGLRVG